MCGWLRPSLQVDEQLRGEQELLVVLCLHSLRLHRSARDHCHCDVHLNPAFHQSRGAPRGPPLWSHQQSGHMAAVPAFFPREDEDPSGREHRDVCAAVGQPLPGGDHIPALFPYLPAVQRPNHS
ncbi:hypothetical protein mRhiFer1_009634 [Rhinolophus ferrumequinum]|uniref:Uncharacterized protein n=1 Tax=Rhinolophus ferrumequinum TaxID=59479 RepID=A0A7J7R5Y2_RHIFE|nr:hypothetical protein mRhiFer1_009634 [Rhinolophus ferrumequinum]